MQITSVFILTGDRLNRGLVYPNFHFVRQHTAVSKKYAYGLDFGFNHPTVLVKID